MTNEEFDERKLYLKQTIKVKDVLFRYGIKVERNRCRGFCHNGKSQDTLKVFDDGVQCFAGCGCMDIFQIVQHFEHCDFMTAFRILGGEEESLDENTKRKMAAEREKEKHRIERERKRKEKIKHICKVIDLYQTLELEHEPLSDEWCYCKNKLCYWIYLLDYYLDLKIK